MCDCVPVVLREPALGEVQQEFGASGLAPTSLLVLQRALFNTPQITDQPRVTLLLP